jgi:photosystem II stability/assembly factor-like uncharacterized protein
MKRHTLAPRLVIYLFLTTLLCTPIQSLLPASAQQGGEALVYSQDFESGTPPDWRLDPGWEVVASEGGHSLAGSGHVWATWNSPSLWFNFRYTFRLRLDPGAALHANIRLSGPSRYFIGLSRNFTYISKQTGPETFQNSLIRGSGIASGWHTIELAAFESQVSLSVDGKPWLKYDDPDPLQLGGLAFETLETAKVWIDDLQVYAPQEEISSLQWKRMGGPLGGLGYDVRMRPDNPDIMYVTDANAGVFKSDDGGASWYPDNRGITARTGGTGELIPVFCLTMDPSNYDILWAGTQFQRGIFKSVDTGESWQKMDHGITERDLTTRGFGVDPHNSQVVFAAAEVSSWEWNGAPLQGQEFDLTKGVVYKTTDGGENWVKVWEGDNLARYVWIDPRNSDVVYVSTGIFDREAANSDPGKNIPGGVGVIKSTDGGKTWQPMTQGMHNLYVGSLFMHPQNPDILLAGTGNVTYNQGNGVYLSRDGGQNWKQTLAGVMIQAVEFSTSDPQIAYAGGYGGIFSSQDGGMTWQAVAGGSEGVEGWGSPGIMAGHPIDFQVDPRNPQRMFSNQYGGGNFLTTDAGHTWIPASKGYTGAMIRDIVVDPTLPGRVIAATRSGLFASYNGGEDWSGISFRPFYAGDWHAVALDPSDPQHMISELTCNRILLASRDGGLSWSLAGRAPDDTRIGFGAIEFAPSDPKRVYAASTGFYSCGSFDSNQPGAGVYFSQDGGDSWQPSPDPLVSELAFKSLAVHPQNANNVFAGSFNKGLYRSMDGGQSWRSMVSGLPADGSFTALRFHPQDANILFAGRFQGALYRSQDGGETWTPSVVGLPAESSITDIIFDPNDPQVMYVSDLSSGVYQSEDGGSRWHTINAGLELRSVNSLALSQDGQHLYAGSEGMGVFRLDLNDEPPAAASPPQALLEVTATVPPQPTKQAVQANPASVPSLVPTEPPVVKTRPPLRCLSGGMLIGFALFLLAINTKRER